MVELHTDSRMNNTTKHETYFITAKVDVIYEVFAKSEAHAIKKFEEALDDHAQRAMVFEDASSMYKIEKIENADTFLGK